MPSQTELQEKVLAALPLVLQHCAQADADANLGDEAPTSTLLLCTLLQVSQSCRAAVKHSGAQCRVESISWTDKSGRKFNSFSSWLREHAGHLRSLIVQEAHHTLHVASEQLVSLGLQVYAYRRIQQQQQQQQQQPRPVTRAAAAARRARPANDTAGRCAGIIAAPLRLQALQWDRMESPAVLQAVSMVTCLTKLCLRRRSTEHATPAMLAALGNLMLLRSLEVECATYLKDGYLPQQFTETLAQLSCLTRLVVQSIPYVPGALAHLPVSLQELELWVERRDSEVDNAVSLQLGHLSALVELKLQWCPGPP